MSNYEAAKIEFQATMVNGRTRGSLTPEVLRDGVVAMTDALSDGVVAMTDALRTGLVSANSVGAPNGVAALDGSGKVPATQLPSYVDDVVELPSLAAFPVNGESGKIYVASDTGFTYRWSGSIYIEITSSSTGAHVNHTHDTRYPRHDAAQSLTAAQQSQVRANILAAPIAALAYADIVVNPCHVVSQEHGDNAVTGTGYVTDQWAILRTGSMATSCQRVTDAPPGYDYALRCTITTAQASLGASDGLNIFQTIERQRLTRLAPGGANAKSSKIGLWVKASVAGNYSVALRDWTGSAVTQSWLGSLTIASVNTWEYHVLSVPPLTSGTWGAALNSAGAFISICLGSGATFTAAAGLQTGNLLAVTGQTNLAATLNATFAMTGVTWLPGDDAPTADTAWMCQRHVDDELRACQRYWRPHYTFIQFIATGADVLGVTSNWEQMRVAPAASRKDAVDDRSNINASYPTLEFIKSTGARALIVSNVSGMAVDLGRLWHLNARM
jgi:hypothetical protein